MDTTAVVAFSVLALAILAQGALTAWFLAVLIRFRRTLPADRQCPKAAVVLCLRGTDPFLESTIRALLDLDYPDYEVLVIVDSREDPAWAAVEDLLRRHPAPRIRMQPLQQRRETCSLKCSSLAQAVNNLDDSVEIVALCDADTIPHRAWLRELVAPMADPRVGAATGNRWYMPAEPTWASLVRYLWNAAAVVQMYCYGIPWGGTLALKTRVLRQADLLDRWGQAFCEDTMLYRVLRQQGLRVAFVPSLMMVNRETCDLGGFFHWVRRQLLTARLYHPGWPAVVAHGTSTPLLLLAGVGLLAAACRQGHLSAAAWLGAGLAMYLGALPILMLALEAGVRRIVRERGESADWIRPGTALKLLPAILLTQLVYPFGLISAIFARNVEWRGVRYRVDGPWRIRLVHYRPHPRQSSDGLASL